MSGVYINSSQLGRYYAGVGARKIDGVVTAKKQKPATQPPKQKPRRRKLQGIIGLERDANHGELLTPPPAAEQSSASC